MARRVATASGRGVASSPNTDHMFTKIGNKDTRSRIEVKQEAVDVGLKSAEWIRDFLSSTCVDGNRGAIVEESIFNLLSEVGK